MRTMPAVLIFVYKRNHHGVIPVFSGNYPEMTLYSLRLYFIGYYLPHEMNLPEKDRNPLCSTYALPCPMDSGLYLCDSHRKDKTGMTILTSRS